MLIFNCFLNVFVLSLHHIWQNQDVQCDWPLTVRVLRVLVTIRNGKVNPVMNAPLIFVSCSFRLCDHLCTSYRNNPCNYLNKGGINNCKIRTIDTRPVISESFINFIRNKTEEMLFSHTGDIGFILVFSGFRFYIFDRVFFSPSTLFCQIRQHCVKFLS